MSSAPEPTLTVLLEQYLGSLWSRLDAGLSGEAEVAVRRLVLDCAVCCAAGLHKPEVMALSTGLAGADGKLSPADTAFVSGVAVCWDEACEGLARAHGRPGIHAYAALLGVISRRDVSLARFLDAFAAGYEIGGRMGSVLRMPPGQHVDGSWGLFGAVAAIARLDGCTVPETLDRLSAVACQMPASLYLPITEGKTARNLYVGHAAATALKFAVAGAAGITAPRGAIGVMTGKLFRLDINAWPAADVWLVCEAYLKPYASVRHCHYPAAAAERLYPALAGRGGEITAIRLATYAEAVTYCGNRDAHAPIKAQFSLSFATARMLAAGSLGPEAYFADAMEDPVMRRLESMVGISVDEDRFPEGQRGARLEVEIGGETLSAEVDGVRGDASHPWDEAALASKARAYLPDGDLADRLVDGLLSGKIDGSAADLLL